MKLLLLSCGLVGSASYWALSSGFASEDFRSPPEPPEQPAPVYESKIGIEQPAEQLVSTAATPSSTPTTPPVEKVGPPAARPGKVTWHKDFPTACRASRESGKPVLLFQLMGKLDEVFC